MAIRNMHKKEIPHKRTHKARSCACSFSFVNQTVRYLYLAKRSEQSPSGSLLCDDCG